MVFFGGVEIGIDGQVGDRNILEQIVVIIEQLCKFTQNP